MARGKHSKLASHRRDVATEKTLTDLRAALDAELEALEDARARDAALDLDREQLAGLLAVRDRRAAPEAARLAAEIDVLTWALEETRTAVAAAYTQYDRASDKVMTLAGTGNDGLELLGRALGMPGSVTVFDRAPNAVAAQRLQRARGLRRLMTADEDRDSNERWILRIDALAEHPALAGYRDVLDDRLWPREDLDDAGREALAAFDAEAAYLLQRGWSTTDPDGWALWHPSPLLTDPAADPDHPVAAAFGVPATLHPPGDARPVPRRTAVPLPGEDWSAARRDSLALASPGDVLPAWRDWLHARTALLDADAALTAPWAPADPYPTPADALAVQLRYLRSAGGAWVRADYADDNAGTSTAATWGQLTCAVAGAVPFWLPPGHSAGYLDSQPLQAEDRDDLRLPYPQVVVTFADPVLLPARDGADLDPDAAQALTLRDWWALNLVSRSDKPSGIIDWWRCGDRVAHATARPVAGDVIAARGAVVEGVLLMADARGRLRDRFAWLVAVPGAYDGVLARWVIPADLPATAHADLIWNLAAVAAWGDWHEAASPAGSSGPEHRDWLAAGGPGGVRVLDVATTAGRAQDSEDTGRSIAAHMRRGHWRRQRYGTGLSMVRRVRIAPVLVNAGKGELAPRVYRMPMN